MRRFLSTVLTVLLLICSLSPAQAKNWVLGEGIATTIDDDDLVPYVDAVAGFQAITKAHLAEALFGPLTIDQVNGRLGIGTTNPNNKLDIVTGIGTGEQSETTSLRLRSNATNGNNMSMLLGVNTAGIGGNNQGYAYLQSAYWGGGNNVLALNPLGGPVTIGTTDPNLWGLLVKSTAAISSDTLAGNTLMGGLLFTNDSPYLNAPASIYGVYDKSFWAQGSGLVFNTVSGADVSGTNGVERMRISSDGNIGIGTTAPLYPLHIQKDGLGNLPAAAPQSIVNLENATDATAVNKSQDPAGLRLAGRYWDGSASQTYTYEIGVADNGGGTNTEFYINSKRGAGNRVKVLGVEAAGYFTTPIRKSNYMPGAAANEGIYMPAGGTATAGGPNQYSPYIQLEGDVWNTTTVASQPAAFREYISTTSGSSPSFALNWAGGLTSSPTNILMSLTSSGTLSVSKYKLAALNTAPASATDTCTTGEIRDTAEYHYLCAATNTWVRSAYSTW